jgi:fimbrial chaperone protein
MKPRPWLLIAMLSFCAAGANATTLTISPVSVFLDSGLNSAVLEVKNQESHQITLQARIYGWSQSVNEDVLVPTSDIIMSPPIATISAGGSQTFRLLLRPGAKAEPGLERHYRILLDQIPAASAGPARVGFAMRSSIPVFVMSAKPTSSSLVWGAARDGNGAVIVTATNATAAYDRIFELAVVHTDGSVHNGVPQGTNGYVLPHAQRQWAVPGENNVGSFRLNITTRNGKTEETLLIAP